MVDSSTVVSLAAAVISAGSAAATAYISRRIVLRDRRRTAFELAERYRVSLLQAAFDLHARLWNIGRAAWLTRRTRGSQSEAEYATRHTVYLIGQYLCWAEIQRREAIGIGDRRRQGKITATMERIRNVMETDGFIQDPVLQVFRGNQRAIGEVMITTITAESPAGRAGPRWDCIGYPVFVKALDEDKETTRWFAGLLGDLDALAADLDKHLDRLTALQHALLELINLLDPAGTHVPVKSRVAM